MDIAVFDPAELDLVMRALRTAVCGDAPLTPEGLAFLRAYGAIAGHHGAPESLAPVAPGVLTDRIARPHARKRLVQLAGVAALGNRPVTPASATFVQQLAAALATRDPVVAVLAALAQGRRVRARLLTVRRMFRVVIKEAYTSEGAIGVVRFYAALLLRRAVNRERLDSFKRLGLLPEGTLGREYWKHITERGFGFPGEPGGIPQTIVYHDVGHVLSGYSTEPEGEIRQGAFQAGNRREDGFAFLQFVLLQFHQGIRITPVAPASAGLFEPHGVLWAVYRGSQCSADITHQWDFWPLMALPLAEARRRIALLPAAGEPGEPSLRLAAGA